MRDRVKKRPRWVRRTAAASTLLMFAYVYRSPPAAFAATAPPPQRAVTAVPSASPPIDPAPPRSWQTSGDPLPARIAPVAVSMADGASAGGAWALFDGDATSSFAPRLPTRLLIDLGRPTPVDGLGIYGRADGRISLLIPGAAGSEPRRLIDDIDLHGLPLRWNRYPIGAPVVTDKLLIDWSPSTAGAGLRELELWGLLRRSAPSLSSTSSSVADLADRLLADPVAGAVEAQGLPEEREVSAPTVGWGGAASFGVDVPRPGRTFARAFLIYDLVGLPHWSAVRRRINGHALQGGFHAVPAIGGHQVEEISPDWLEQGRNQVEFLAGESFDPSGYKVRNLRVIVIPPAIEDTGDLLAYERVPPELVDGNTQSSPTSAPAAPRTRRPRHATAVIDLPFRRASQPESVSFALDRAPTGPLAIVPVKEGRTLDDQAVTVPSSQLSRGWNRVRLERTAPDVDGLRIRVVGQTEGGGAITEVRVSGSAPPSGGEPHLRVTYPLHGECIDHQVYVRGFVAPLPPGGGAVALSLNGMPAFGAVQPDGSFGEVVSEAGSGQSPGQPWQIDVQAFYPDGRRLTSRIAVDACQSSPPAPVARGNASSPREDVGAPFGQMVHANEAATLEFGGARLEIPAGAVDRDVRVTVRPLEVEQLAALDEGMANATPRGRGFRLGPHGLTFKQPIRVTLPYDPDRFPPGLSEQDLGTYFFDEEIGHWRQVPTVSGDGRRALVVAETTHFTDFINATIAIPDHPTASSLNPNSIKDVKLADPAAGIDLIQPPEAASDGAAHLSYRLDLPPGRQGMRPDLQLTYSSDSPNGWIGVGWDISVPMIQVDTRFGVPRYDPNDETESYVLDGAQLAPADDARDPAQQRVSPLARSAERAFVRRLEGGFEQIIRHGNSPSENAGGQAYYWEVIDKHGTHYIYGDPPGASGTAVLSAPNGGAIYEWRLRSTTDAFGNRIDYRYFVECGSLPGASPPQSWTQIYPAGIDYTANSGLAPIYHVTFLLDDSTVPTRPDAFTSARSGFLVRTAHLLQHVRVSADHDRLTDDEIRTYNFEYLTGEFGKKLLSAVSITHFDPTVIGLDDTAPPARSAFAALLPHLFDRSGCGAMFGALGLVVCPTAPLTNPPVNTLGNNAEFYRHTFDYFRRADPVATHHAFAQLAPWGTVNQSEGLNHSEDISGGVNAFAGVGPTICYPHAGVGGGFTIGDQTDSRAFIDVNGDGIPDAVASDGSAFFGQRDSGYVPGSVPGMGDVSHSNTTDATLGASAHFFAELGAAGVDVSWNSNSSDHELIDIDGDGLPDSVQGGGAFSVAKNNFGVFAANPTFQGFTTNRQFVSGAIQQQIRDQHPPVGTVVAWTAPYFGQIQVGGGIQRVESGGDGVHAAVYRFHPSLGPSNPSSLSTIWARTFAADDVVPCQPRNGADCNTGATITATVEAGDKLFFNTDPLDDIDHDALTWDPQVAYTALCQDNPTPGQPAVCTAIPAANLAQTEPYGPPVYTFSGASDFRLAGPPPQPWLTTVPSTVNVDVNGAFHKLASTSDDVTVEIVQTVAATGQTIVRFSQTFAAGSVVPNQAIALTVPVTATVANDQTDSNGNAQPNLHADSIDFRVLSDTPVDPAAFSWTPELRYESYCRRDPNTNQDVCGAVSCPDGSTTCSMTGDPIPDHPLDRGAVVFDPEVEQPAYLVLPSVTLPQTTPLTLSRNLPTPAFVAPESGLFNVSGLVRQLPVTGGTITSWGNTFVTVQTPGALLAKQSVAPGASPIVSFNGLSVAAGTPLTFTVWVNGTAAASWSPQITFQSTDIFTPPVAVHRLLPSGAAANAPAVTMSAGYHQWSLGQWRTDFGFDPNQIRLVDNSGQSDPPPPEFTTVRPQHLGITADAQKGIAGIAQAAWASTGVDLYIAAGQVKPSRIGANVATLIARGNGPGLRKGSGTTSGVSVTLFGSFSQSSGDSTGDLDLLDLNGDGYPDSFDDQGARFNNGFTGFGPTAAITNFGSIRTIHSRNVRYGFAFGSSASTVANAVHASGTVSTVVSLLPSFGKIYGRSTTGLELVDINGDGLPDHVRRDTSAGADVLVVNFNLGYAFGPDVTWSTPRWTSNVPTPGEIPLDQFAADDDDPNAISLRDNVTNSLQIGYAGLGGGIAQSAGRSYVEPIDINGDGLADQVMKIPNERFLRVKINRGEFFDPEEQWDMPGFTTTSGASISIDNPLTVGFGSNDALGFNENRSFNAGVGIPPITVPLVFVCLVFEVSAQAEFGGGFSEMEMQDVNGDGFPDQVLKKDGDANVYVKISQPGLQHYNLLRVVNNPLGGSFTLDYARAGNLVDASAGVDMPRNHWVLSSVTTENGFLDDQRDSRTTTFDYQQSGFFDRVEREDLGFAHVVTTRADGSFLDETFHNDFYRRGLRRKLIEKDANGALFRKVETTWTLRTAHGAGVPSQFPADLTEVTSFYEGQTADETAPGKTWSVTRDYDDSGNLIAFNDGGDDGAADDVAYTITYQPDIISSAHIFRANFVEARDATGAVLRHRTATYDGRGAMSTLSELMAGGNAADTGAPQNVTLTWVFHFDGVGNLHDFSNPMGHQITFGYDAAAETYQTSITDNTFGYTSSSIPDYKFGVVDSSTDVNQQVEQYNYDEFGRVASIVSPADVGTGHSTINFDYGIGSSHQSFPAVATTRHFDVQHPLDTIDTAVFVDGLARPVQTKKDAVIDDSGTGIGTVGHSVSGHVIYDARSRVFRQGQPVAETDSSIAIDQYTKEPLVNPTTYAYDILSRTRAEQTPDAHGTVHDVDGNPVAQTLTDYNFGALDGATRLTRQVQDPQGKLRTVFLTVRDETVGVREQNRLVSGGVLAPLTTRYVEDPLSQVTKVTDQNGNVVSATYDTLGHLVALVSPDAGRTEYRYDSSGRLGAKQTANLAAAGTLTHYTYVTDRLSTIDFPTSPDVVYTYGASTEAGPSNGNVASRVKSITDESGTETRTYDVLGNVARMVKTPAPLAPTIPKPSYTMSYSYDAFGRVLEMTYPDNEAVSYQYDAGGMVDGATSEGGPSGDVTYVSGLTYDHFGQRRQIALGNGVQSTYTYDGQTRRLSELRTALGSAAIQDLSYGYDLVGNVTTLGSQIPIPAPVPPNTVIAPGPTSYTFGYDDLYQLIAATGRYDGCACGCNNNRQFTLSMTYDGIGNLLHKTQKDVINWPSGRVDTQAATTYDVAYGYQAARPHAPATIGTQTLSYDADGNLKSSSGTFGPARTVTWDEEDRVQSELDRSFTNTYLYNDEGVRTHKRRTGIETVYVNPYYVIRTGTLETKHVMLGESRLASTMSSMSKYGDPTTAGPATFFFYHQDHLQSTGYTTNRLGQILQHDEYFPSGETWFEERANTDARNAQPYLFNAKELDETGLYYYGARYYDPRQSTWISPDPILGQYLKGQPNGGVTRPANLGLYSYSWNNPVVLRDPDGFAVGDAWYKRAFKTAEGVVYGTLETVIPGGTLVNKPNGGDLDSDVLTGMAAGEFATGTVETLVGGAIAAGGGTVEVGTLGAATVVAVPVAVAGVAVAANGVGAVATSTRTLQMASRAADAERAKNIAKGIPPSQLGPSGKPKIHSVDLPNRKAAEDAARSAGQGKPMEHPNDTGQPPHFHPTDKGGKKIPGPHFNYPPKSAIPKR